MHLKRWITAIAGTPLLIFLIFKGGHLLFSLFIGIAAVIALKEYYGIVYNRTGPAVFSAIPLAGFITCPLIVGAAYSTSFQIITSIIAINLLITGLISLSRYKSDPSVQDTITKQALGIIYIPLFLSYLVLIHTGDDGDTWLLFLLILVFMGDTGAYYIGKAIGRNKLCPSISPGKTIEGAVGGLLLSVGAGLLFRYIFLPHLPLGLSILFFICIGIVAPAGDLFESVLKRAGGVKDSGTILPGHGGILDRIDALLFAAPVSYLFKEFIL